MTKVDNIWVWRSCDGAIVKPCALTPDGASTVCCGSEDGQNFAGGVTSEYDLCLTGPALFVLSNAGLLSNFVPFVKVYARVSPEQKADIVRAFAQNGLKVLMCGDGVNDVGALKACDVGVALVNPISVNVSGQCNKQLHRDIALSNMEQVGVPKPGDASIAAPFTAKASSIMAVCDVIRFGRATLVTTMMQQKIMALNCLINSFGLSVLNIKGIRFSDTQMTVSALVTTACMFGLSQSKPAPCISPQQPQRSVVEFRSLLTVMSQFAVHIFCMVYLVQQSEIVAPSLPLSPNSDGTIDFSISRINTVVYLLTLSQQACSIATNMAGEPFMMSWRTNGVLYRSMKITVLFIVVALSGISTTFEDVLELAPCSMGFRMMVLVVIVADFAAALLLDRLWTVVLRSQSRQSESLAWIRHNYSGESF